MYIVLYYWFGDHDLLQLTPKSYYLGVLDDKLGEIINLYLVKKKKKKKKKINIRGLL